MIRVILAYFFPISAVGTLDPYVFNLLDFNCTPHMMFLDAGRHRFYYALTGPNTTFMVFLAIYGRSQLTPLYYFS